MVMNNIEERLKVLEEKIDRVYASVEKTRKYFLAILIVTVVAFVLPLILMVFAIPRFIATYRDLSQLGL